MASIYRPCYTKMDENGKRVKKYSKKWWIKYRDRAGDYVRTAGFRDKQATKALAMKLETQAARRRAGIEEVVDRHVSLFQALEEFEHHLAASGVTLKHQVQTLYNCRLALEGNEWVNSLALTSIQKRVVDLASARKWAAATTNRVIVSAKHFTKYLYSAKILSTDPLMGWELLNENAARVLIRRPLTEEESTTLLAHVLNNQKTFRNLPYLNRYWLYRIALCTGLRRNELATLTPSRFEWDGKIACVYIEARYAKNRKSACLPLPAGVVPGFREFLAATPAGERVWAGSWEPHSAQMIARDCKAAGIKVRTEKGQIDFHSLRHTFITNLAKRGVHPSVAQKLARHADVNLTMKFYTHLDLEDLSSAVEKLLS